MLNAKQEYDREITRKLDQLNIFGRDMVRRHNSNDYLFAFEHLSKRRHWHNSDKAFRDSCRSKWNKDGSAKSKDSVSLPNINLKDSRSSSVASSIDTEYDEDPEIVDEQIKDKFLQVTPVMVELLTAPHSSKIFRVRSEKELLKLTTQKQQEFIQSTATVDPRYQQLMMELQTN